MIILDERCINCLRIMFSEYNIRVLFSVVFPTNIRVIVHYCYHIIIRYLLKFTRTPEKGFGLQFVGCELRPIRVF